MTKLAQFKCHYANLLFLEEWAERYQDYTRISEYADVEFVPRNPADYVPEQIAVIDQKIADLTTEFTNELNDLKEQKANLLAITYDQ